MSDFDVALLGKCVLPCGGVFLKDLAVRVPCSSSGPPYCVQVAMPIVRPSCPHCSRPMSLGAEAGEFACQCGATMGEGVLTLRWTVGKKHLASKKTRLILKTREPDLLFTLAPDVAASNLEGRCAASLGSNPKALVSVRCISMAHEGLHLASASLGDGESEEIHHSFD